MIIKRNFNPTKVVHYVKMELLISTVVSVGIWWMYENGIAQVSLPFSIAAILGSALAIFIAFRNNSAYGRWWEARTVWGGIVNSSRVLARLVITFTDSHANQANYEKERSEAFKKHLIYSCIAGPRTENTPSESGNLVRTQAISYLGRLQAIDSMPK